MKVWRDEVENNADNQVLCYLVGNKADLEEEREVSQEMAAEMKQNLQCDHATETSPVTDQGIRDCWCGSFKC